MSRKCICCNEDVAIGKNTIGDENNHFWHVSCVLKKPVNLEIFQETDLSKLIPANKEKLDQLYITRSSFLLFFIRKLIILAKNSEIIFDEKIVKASGVGIEQNNIKKFILNQTTKCFITMCQRLENNPKKIFEKICEANPNNIKLTVNINYSAENNGIILDINKYNLKNYIPTYRDLRAGYIYSLQ